MPITEPEEGGAGSAAPDAVAVETGPAPTAFPYFKRRPQMKFFTFAEDEPFRLESGRALGPVTVAYETYGELNEDGTNAILVEQALTGDSHCASHGPDDEPGWWEGMVGPGKPLDTNRYFVICANVLGGCQGTTGPATVDPRTGRPYGMTFPMVTILDMVRVQEVLLRHLGVTRLLTVIGGSMGGMQTLQWAVSLPEWVHSIVPIATPGRAFAQSIGYNEAGRQAIMRDPAWRGGDYYGTPGPVNGLAVARMLAMITYQSNASMDRRFGRRLQVKEGQSADDLDLFNFSTQFQVESYLNYQGRKLVNRFDANSYLYLTRALDLFDLGRGFESYEAALARIQCPTLVIGIDSDILYPTYQQKEFVDILKALGRPVQYREMVTPHGHDAFLIDFDQLGGMVREFIESLPPPEPYAGARR